MNTNLYAAIDNRKVAIIGSGYVGASIAYALTIRGLAREIILIDVDDQKAVGEAMDIQHGIPYMGTSSVRVGDYSDCRNCDLIIITAGRNRKPGEARLDMIEDNIGVLKEVTLNIKQHYTHGVILVVSNPVDILTYCVSQWMDLPNGKVFGTGCILDTSRLVRAIADYIGINIEAIKCSIVGEHGDTQVPLWSRLSVAGIPMEEYCESVSLEWNDNKRDEIYSNVKNMGAEIIKRKGRTHYGIATCVCSVADAVLNQRPTIAPVTSTLNGEYGICDVAISVPSVIGVNGVERRIEEHLSSEELSALRKSSEIMRSSVEHIDSLI